MKLDASFPSQIYSNDIHTTCTSFVTNRHKTPSWKCPDANMAAMTGLDETMPKCAPNSTPLTTNWTLDQRWESPSSSKFKKWDDFSLMFDSWLGWWTSRRNRLNTGRKDPEEETGVFGHSTGCHKPFNFVISTTCPSWNAFTLNWFSSCSIKTFQLIDHLNMQISVTLAPDV